MRLRVALVVALVGSLFVVQPGAQQRRRNRMRSAHSVGVAGVVTSGQLQYKGCFGMPTNITQSVDSGALAGHVVSGSDQLFAFDITHYYDNYGYVTAATSASAFTISSLGSGGFGPWAVNQTLNLYPVTGTSGLPQHTVIQTVTGSGPYAVTVSPALSGTPAVGDHVWHDPSPIVEVLPPSEASWTAGGDCSSAPPRASLVAQYLDPYQGRRISWRVGAMYPNDNPLKMYPGGLQFVSGLGVCSTYYDTYAVANSDDWGLICSDLNSATPTSVTVYGPWRVRSTNGDSTNYYGPKRFGYLSVHPTTNELMGMGIAASGDATNQWGPGQYGITMPTTSTPSGFSASDLSAAHRYLEYYYPSNLSDSLATPSGPVRTFRFTGPSGYTYIFEGDYWSAREQVNPANNGGVGTWTDSDSSQLGGVWIKGTNRSGFLATFVAPLSSDTNPASTNAGHSFYFNSGQITLGVSGVTGTWSNIDVLHGATSGADAAFTQTANDDANIFRIFQTGPQQVTNFQVGETLNNVTSGGHATITRVHRHDVCTHGLSPVLSVTGPGVTFSRPFMAFFDDSRLTTNGAGTTTDYTTEASEIVDAQALYGIVTAPQTQPQARTLYCGYYNTTTKYLYCGAPHADLTLGSAAAQTVVHVWKFLDTP